MRSPEERSTGPDGRESLPEAKRKGERLIALLAGGAVALNFPLLSIFQDVKLLRGIPSLFLYIFFIWALIIGVTALVLRSRPQEPPAPGERRNSRPGE